MPGQPYAAMSRGKIKCKVVESTIQNKDVLDMFHSVLGTGEGTNLNPMVVYPKYLAIRGHCDRFLRLLEAFRATPVLRDSFDDTGMRLAGYIAQLRREFAATFCAADLVELHPPSPLEAATGMLLRYEQLSKEEYEAFVQVYGEVKSCNIVNTIVVTCKNLLPHRHSLKDRTKLRDRFLRTPGLSFAPLPDLPSLNFKQLYISDRLEAQDRSFVLMVLHKMYTIGHDVYEAVLAPDVDVRQFVEVIIASLDDVKKAIPRCNEAFDKIRESVGLLEGNFGDYYKDYVASNNPTIIMENFVLDVSKNTKASPKITAQFRRIINYYREQAKLKADNPKLQSLFQQVDKNFQELERRSRDHPGGEEDTESSSEEDPPADAPAAPSASGACPAGAPPPLSKKAAKRAAKKKKRRQEKKDAAGRQGAEEAAARGHSRVLLADDSEEEEDEGTAPSGAAASTAPPEGAEEDADDGAEDGAEERAEEAMTGLGEIFARLQGLGGAGPEAAAEDEESEGEDEGRAEGEAAGDAAAEEALAALLGETPEAPGPEEPQAEETEAPGGPAEPEKRDGPGNSEEEEEAAAAALLLGLPLSGVTLPAPEGPGAPAGEPATEREKIAPPSRS